MFIKIGWIFLYKRFFYKVDKESIHKVDYCTGSYEFQLYNV